MQATFRMRLLATLGAVVAVVAATLAVASPASAASPDFWEQYASYSNGFGKCIDVAGQTSGVAIQSYTCNGTVNQQVSLDTRNSDGYEFLRFASSGRCVEVPGSSQGNNVALDLQDCNGAFNQQWKRVAVAQNVWHIVSRSSGKCIGVLNEDTTDRTPLVQFDCDSGKSESWKFSGNVPLYRTIARWSPTSKCLDTAGQVNGTGVQQYTCNQTVNQQWLPTNTTDGWVTLTVASSGRCLTVVGAGQSDGAGVQILDCNGGFNQQWKRSNVSGRSGDVIWMVRHSGKCLTVPGNVDTDRTFMTQATCDPLNNIAQNWHQWQT